MGSRPPSPSHLAPKRDDLFLDDGSRVAVIGGGPAGSFFTYFLFEMAERIGMELAVDIYEPRDFTKPAPHGCNMCGGIISESLVQLLATEGINLPSTVVQRGIDSYVLHMDVGTVRIEPTRREKRIAAVYRGGGPRGVVGSRYHSFDGHLLELAKGRGAQVHHDRVEGIDRNGGKPRITTKKGTSTGYDLLVGAVGVNTSALKLFEEMGAGYRAPGLTKTYICELFLGERTIKTYFGNAMHMFLLNLPRLEFAAMIPKGDYVTMVMLGTGIDKTLVEAFFSAPEVRKCFPADWSPPADFCRCSPAINISAAVKPFADRMVLIGDSGVSRLYKDGIGGAYRTAKAAARTAVFEGVAEEDFRKGYLPVCRSLSVDNGIGKVVFGITTPIQKTTVLRKGVLRMTTAEQEARQWNPRMSDVLWDTFTGSAAYAYRRDSVRVAGKRVHVDRDFLPPDRDRVRVRVRLQHLAEGQPTRGLRILRPENRPKSLSAVQSSRTPCCRQIAATRASWTWGPETFAAARRDFSCSQYPSASPSNTRVGDSSQASTCAMARPTGVGGAKIRGCVAMARNSWMHGHGIAQGALPSARPTMQSRAAPCQEDSSRWA